MSDQTTITTKRSRPSRILAAFLALSLGATTIPATAFASSADYPYLDGRTASNGGGNRGGGEQRARDNREQRSQHARGGNRRGGHDNHYRGHRRNGGHHGYRGHRGHGDGDAALAGAIVGLAIGAIMSNSYNQSRHAPPSRTYYEPAGSGAGYPPEPFTDDWYAYCASKYRSFDPETGTFQPYEGPRRLCR